jgi:hypothetical protein
MASSRNTQDKREIWLIDQVTKSEFFHQKLHEYGLLEIAYAIENVQGENLDWNKKDLGISENAWKKVIHRGIQPVRVFAHPDVLRTVHRSVGYYQKLALVSLKSMNNIGLTITTYESGQNKRPMNQQKAEEVCRRLNELISRLIESDDVIGPREFDLWRGMTAGSTAQGSWQNKKGDRTEDVIKGIITRRIQSKGLLVKQSDDGKELRLEDSRILEYGSEPDLAFYNANHQTLALGLTASGAWPNTTFCTVLHDIARIMCKLIIVSAVLRSSVSKTAEIQTDSVLNRALHFIYAISSFAVKGNVNRCGNQRWYRHCWGLGAYRRRHKEPESSETREPRCDNCAHNPRSLND